jgi:ABC-2 type transport system permease protein
MTVVTMPHLPARTAAPARTVTAVTTFKAEWTKLRTLRSTWITLGAASLVSVGFGALIAATTVSRFDAMTAKERLRLDPTSDALIGLLFATVFLGSLAVRSITAEYGSGMIRTTFAALPRRRTVVGAKAAILALVAFPVALVSNVVAFVIAQQIFATKHVAANFSQPGVVRAIVFGALAVSLVSVIGLSLGGLVKRTAGATTLLSLIVVGGSIFGGLLPVGISQYLPSSAIQAMVTVNHSAGGLVSPVAGLLVLAAYAAAGLGAASMVIARRDA